MGIKFRINADNEHDFRRMLVAAATPYLHDILNEFPDAAEAAASPPQAPYTPPPPDEAPPPLPPIAASEPRKQGRPKGSTNKPKTNGGEPQTEAASNGNGLLALAEQIQIITDATHDQPDKFKPLLVPLREKLGVQYISKAGEKDRPALQEFINEHGLAV